MRPEPHETERQRAKIRAREQDALLIQQAAAKGNTLSDYHPDNLRAQIARLQARLNRAGFQA